MDVIEENNQIQNEESTLPQIHASVDKRKRIVPELDVNDRDIDF